MVMQLSPDDKKAKYMDALMRLKKEMDALDASGDDKEESEGPMEDDNSNEFSKPDEASEMDSIDESSEEPHHDPMGDDEIKEMLKSKNSLPKKKTGVVSVSIMSAMPKMGKKFGSSMGVKNGKLKG